jgi:hypothetical protein
MPNEILISKKRLADWVFPPSKRKKLRKAGLDLWKDEELQSIILSICGRPWAFNPIEYTKMAIEDLSWEPRVRATLRELTGLSENEKRELLEILAWGLFATLLEGCRINP